MPKNNPKVENYRMMAASVAIGLTIKDAAAKHGVAIDHAYKVSRLPAFKKIVNEVRAEAMQAIVGSLTKAAEKAIKVVETLLDTEDEKTRLNAAKAILSCIGPMSELGELRGRIDALEQARKQEPKIAKRA